AVEAFLSGAGLSDDEIAMVRSSPTWKERVGAAHTLGREERAAWGLLKSSPTRTSVWQKNLRLDLTGLDYSFLASLSSP
ncbi:MAG: hypothetical protein ACRDIU_10045, partial [Actinomycetota bacterium]